MGVVKIGVLGGTFDPPHRGHLSIATEAKTKLGLNRVIFVPAGRPWLKAGTPVSPAEDRFEMVRLAIQDEPSFEVSRIEVDRTGPSYTADTLEELHSTLGDIDLFFILGWDSVTQLPQWQRASRILELCRLAAIPRPGYPRPDLDTLEGLVPGMREGVVFLDVPLVDISATEIRERVAKGESVADLVPPAVEKYIVSRRLYRQ